MNTSHILQRLLELKNLRPDTIDHLLMSNPHYHLRLFKVKLTLLIHQEPTNNPPISASFSESYSMVCHFGCWCNQSVLFEDEHGLWSGNGNRKVAQNVSTLSNFIVWWIKVAARISWFVSCQLFLWDYLKNNAFKPQPATMDEIKAKQLKLCPMTCHNAWWTISLSTSYAALTL